MVFLVSLLRPSSFELSPTLAAKSKEKRKVETSSPNSLTPLNARLRCAAEKETAWKWWPWS